MSTTDGNLTILRRAAGWLIALVALLPGALGLTVSTQIDFLAPAQVQGDVAVLHGEWALIIFREPEKNSFELSLPDGGQQSNTTYVIFSRPASSDHEWFPVPLPTETRSLVAVAGTVQFRTAWAFLFVRADSISLTIPGAAARLNYAESGAWVEEQLPPARFPEGTTPPLSPPSFQIQDDQVSLGLRANQSNSPATMTLHVEGLRHLSWHNATVSCQSASCPESGQTETASFDAAGTTRLERATYIDLETTTGTLHGTGEAWLAAIGGKSLHLGLQGAARFPDANLQGQCGSETCPDPLGKTLLAQGTVTLEGLSTGRQPDRLQAAMSGFNRASFDESPAWALTVPEEVGVGLAVVGLAFLVKALVGLFSHPLTSDEALDHPRRRTLYAAVCQHPGSTYRVLMEATDLSDGVTRHHLRVLVRVGLIVAVGQGTTVHYFENHGRYDNVWKPVIALRDAHLRQLHEWLSNHPDARQKEILELAHATWRWSPATTRKRLLRLQAWGLVMEE